MPGFRETTWGKIIVGGLVWFVVIMASLLAWDCAGGRAASNAIRYLVFVASIVVATIAALKVVREPLSFTRLALGSVTWYGSFATCTALFEGLRSFEGPLEYVGDMTGNWRVADVLEGMDVFLPIAMVGAAVYFGGQALLEMGVEKNG